jgi:hypothetical protein
VRVEADDHAVAAARLRCIHSIWSA